MSTARQPDSILPALRLAQASADPAPPAEGVTPLVADPLAAAVRPLTYSRQQLADALGIDTSTLDRWDAAGRIGPRPLRISGPRGRKLYSRQEVADWVAVGCPAADEWRVRQAARNGKR